MASWCLLTYIWYFGTQQSITSFKVGQELVGLFLILSWQRNSLLTWILGICFFLSMGNNFFSIGVPLTTSNVQHHGQNIGFRAFPLNKNLCTGIVDITTYLQLTWKLRVKTDQYNLLFTTRSFLAQPPKSLLLDQRYHAKVWDQWGGI